MNGSNRTARLVTDFAFAVRAQNEAIERHDPVAGNAWALKFCAAAKELLERDKGGLEAFCALLEDPRVDVRTMAAAFLIPFKTEESRKVLEASAEGVGMVSLGARIALERWEREGQGIDLS